MCFVRPVERIAARKYRGLHIGEQRLAHIFGQHLVIRTRAREVRKARARVLPGPGVALVDDAVETARFIEPARKRPARQIPGLWRRSPLPGLSAIDRLEFRCE